MCVISDVEGMVYSYKSLFERTVRCLNALRYRGVCW